MEDTDNGGYKDGEKYSCLAVGPKVKSLNFLNNLDFRIFYYFFK